MVVPELRPWQAARPRLARVANAVRPRLARARAAAAPRVARWASAAKPQVGKVMGAKPWPYTAVAATAGLVLAAGVVTATGPWDSSGQRTAERDRAAAQQDTGGTDHGADPGMAGAPKPAPSAASVLTGLDGATNLVKSAPNSKALAGVLDPLLADPALGSRRTAVVVDLATGKRLYGRGADEALTPASTTKIATAVAALSALGADHRLTTRTVYEPDTKELVLVGGGDPTLTAHEDSAGQASLRTLAARTAAALKGEVREVTLSYDTTLYAGSELHPIGVNDNIAAVSALMVDEARTDGSTSGPVRRVPDPAADATRRFAEFLNEHGIRTTSPGPSKATERAQPLAKVQSPPLSALVERMMTNSDNDIAEALARHTALATGERADFAGAGRAIQAQLKKLGLPLKGARFEDGSGLDRDGRLTANLLSRLLLQAADPSRPELRPTLTGLPVAGFTGTLTGRYADGAAGIVRAKTGTLTGVNALAGTAVTRDGHVLGFAFLASETTDVTAAQRALDRAATALTTSR
ncbi:D-alanyl-D-alanine carboxypeptidase/D-alanyl-D-alanine-endopeptidase [Streptomyces spinoverrucosus]|uniref:D-alanyl-D-alanine carboxypeptidase/D-alanyl-D-alanine endopeptidase n=1 Tax=Streptomyces spinoverrucosus TaxID=284043 RepID=UPI0018C3F144|nr:D-alanyl-D-alanine carboxypeptidase/D-alanyl-D-alanine-endopeptidase [Streptomyces spinoverrucosus]MBG0853459.1 D-alanyl-D-alanine carboxypeptidase/D-alanyl-D-alanine-endopeptidase [Streptomyces spinoverrucosus]